ncbi:Beta-lactamase-related protein, partial [mine drainage metagenome]
RECGPLSGWDAPGSGDYSEYAGWHFLGEIIEASTGNAFNEVIREEVLEPLGMVDTFYGMSASEHKKTCKRIGVMMDLSTSCPVPMLADKMRTICSEWNPGYGCYGTAGDLVKMVIAIDDALNKREGAILTFDSAYQLAREGRGLRLDRTTRENYDFALGFMLDLVSNGFGRYISST